MIWLCNRCGDPYCDHCEEATHDDCNPVCALCLDAEPDPDLERKAQMENYR